MSAYSDDLRQRIVRAVDQGHRQAEIAAAFQVALATIGRYLKQRRETGRLAVKPIPGRPPTKRAALEAALPAQLAAHDPVRTTEFAPAIPSPASTPPHTPPPSGYASPQVGLSWKAGRFSGQDFALQPDGTLRCPANQKLIPHEHRREIDGSLRVVYGAGIRSRRPCPLREQCQWQGSATAKPRQVSVLLHPLPVGSAPLLWRDWSRRAHRRACIQLVRHQHIEMSRSPSAAASPSTAEVILSRAKRAHARLCWQERLARNARPKATGQITITLFGVPDAFATLLGLRAP